MSKININQDSSQFMCLRTVLINGEYSHQTLLCLEWVNDKCHSMWQMVYLRAFNHQIVRCIRQPMTTHTMLTNQLSFHTYAKRKMNLTSVRSFSRCEMDNLHLVMTESFLHQISKLRPSDLQYVYFNHKRF